MAVPNFQKFILPVLQSVEQAELHNSELKIKTISKMSLTEGDLNVRTAKGTDTKVNDRISWAKTYLKQAGLLEFPKRGYAKITPEGKKVLGLNLKEIDIKFLMDYSSFRVFHGKDNTSQNEADIVSKSIFETVTPEEKIESGILELEKTIKDEILDKILKASPQFFEQLIVDLMLAMGYGGSKKEAGERIGKSGDGGIDGIIKEDPLGLDLLYLQAKRYSPENTIGRPKIQEFVGSLSGFKATKGVFVTTSSFSKEAKEYASTIHQRVILIDGEELTNLMLQYGTGVREIRALRILKIDEDYFEEV